jgi:hypothetical protein
MDNSTNRHSGWITFAAAMLVIVGLYHVLSGAAAIAESDSVTAQVQEVLYDIDIETWGWFWLIVGVAQLISAILLFSRSLTSAVIAMLGAGISASFAVFIIFVAPLWAIAVLALDVGIIWIITANIEDFGADIP